MFFRGDQPYTFNFNDNNFEKDVRTKLQMIYKQETVFVCYVDIKENRVYLTFERPVNIKF